MASSNGLNGTNGHHHHVNGTSSSSSSSSSSSKRTLLIQHVETHTKVVVPGIPETVYGLADSLRDEFVDHLKQDGRADRLTPEAAAGNSADDNEDDGDEDEEGGASKAATNNSALFLLSYWLDFLVQSTALQHAFSTPILAASRDHFSTRFLANGQRDIHDLAAGITDTDEKKLVVRSWVAACARLGGTDFGAKGKIWRDDASTKIYAVFGGQGSNEYYWDEMEVSEAFLVEARRGPG